nr:MAG TPA: hypothetical protein [Caudoviricetes sp.]
MDEVKKNCERTRKWMSYWDDPEISAYVEACEKYGFIDGLRLGLFAGIYVGLLIGVIIAGFALKAI